MNKSVGIVLIIIIVGALAYPKVKPLLSGTGEATGPNPNASSLQVNGYVIKPGEVQDKIFTTGTILANEEVELRSEVSGKVMQVTIREGQPVKEGDMLLKINDSELQAQLQRAQYRLNLATERERRQRKLLEKGGISQEDYDATLNEVNVLKSEVALIRSQIDKTELRAPFDGMVGLKYVSEGSYITPSTRVASLQDISPVKIDFSIPERYVNRVGPGDRITFTVQGTPGRFEGEIYAIEPKIESRTRTLQLRAISENPGGLLVPGAFADLELILQTIDDALMVPAIALIPELQGQKVFLYRNGRVVQQTVQTGIRTDERVQLTSGIAAGDTVLTTGLLQVQPGMPVVLKEIQQGRP